MSQDERIEETGPAPGQPPQPEEEHEFLMPGPTPTSNKGCFAWGLSWVLVSVVLLIIVAVMTVSCYFISILLGIL